MKYIIILMFLVVCDQKAPLINEFKIRDALDEMYDKGILENRKDTLYVLSGASVEKISAIPKEIKLGAKTMKIVTEGDGYPIVKLSYARRNPSDSTELSIRFLAMNYPGTQHKGAIYYHVDGEKVTFENVYSISQVE